MKRTEFIMKSYTDLEQSEKLAEILPLETSDMHYIAFANDVLQTVYCHKTPNVTTDYIGESDIPCWSLTALLNIIPNVSIEESITNGAKTWFCTSVPKNTEGFESDDYDNPIDACYEMILKLKEQNLL